MIPNISAGVGSMLFFFVAVFFVALSGLIMRKKITFLVLSILIAVIAVVSIFLIFALHYKDLNGILSAFFIASFVSIYLVVGLNILLIIYKKEKKLHIRLFEKLGYSNDQ